MPNRLPPFDLHSASAAQKAVLDDILAGPRGNLNGPFLGWIHSPELAQHAQKLGAFCRYDTGLPLRLSELAILIIAAHWQSQAEWFIHYPIALQAGLPESVAEALRTGQPPTFDYDYSDPAADAGQSGRGGAADDALVYAFTTELLARKRVSDAVYQQAVQRFGHPVTLNLVALLGYYTLVAMTLNVFGMRAENQDTEPFAEPT